MRKKIHTKHGAVSANKLLARPPMADYLTEWTNLLAKGQEAAREMNERALLLFRLGSEWFGIEAKYLSEVCVDRPIHRIPHRASPILMGLVNLRGQLRLAVDLKALLEVEDAAPETEGVLQYARMLSIQKGRDIWVFPVDEVYGIHHVNLDDMENVPVTVCKSATNFLRGVIPWKERSLSYLDEELLFSSLHRSVL